MVYCGKASQGCQNCRTRRIKCDKLRPDCSQCVRVGKKCPGYRDQLSLMFRDESSKVIQKAHAQWGVGEGPEAASPSSSPSSSSSSSASPSTSTSAASFSVSDASPSSSRRTPDVSPSTISRRPSTTLAPLSAPTAPIPRLKRAIDLSLEDQGTSFFISRYIIGHPDEPKTAEEFKMTDWASDPALRDVMVAVGLAGLANLQEDKQTDMMLLSRERYGMALRQTGQLVQSKQAPSLDVTIRAIVTLAMFEMVKGESLNIQAVHVHIMGGVALMRSWNPRPSASFGGIRGIVQLAYTMFVSAHMASTPLHAAFYDWMAFVRSVQSEVDYPSTDLGVLIARFLDQYSGIKNSTYMDGHENTARVIQQLLDLEREFAEWELALPDPWLYRTVKNQDLPSQAVFQGEYHTYQDMWFARMWNHYRWARLLLNESIVRLMDDNPISSSTFPSYSRSLRLERIRILAREMLVSIPAHWRHPLLEDKLPLPVEQKGPSGSGAAGVIMASFQITAAACSIGVPDEYWDWTQDILRCIWSDMGMLHAKNMMEQMVAHRARMQKMRLAFGGALGEQVGAASLA